MANMVAAIITVLFPNTMGRINTSGRHNAHHSGRLSLIFLSRPSVFGFVTAYHLRIGFLENGSRFRVNVFAPSILGLGMNLRRPTRFILGVCLVSSVIGFTHEIHPAYRLYPGDGSAER